jgi:hypothetical protein
MPGLLGIKIGGCLVRKGICLIMGILFLVTIISGIVESHVHPGNSGLHTVVAVLFIASIVIHVAINRKSFTRYFLTGSANKTN